MVVVESMCLLAANVQGGNSLQALSNSWTWYLMYQSTEVMRMSLFRSTFPSLSILRVDGLQLQRLDLAPPPLVLLVAIAHRNLDVLRMHRLAPRSSINTPRKRSNLHNQEQEQLIPYKTFSARKLGPRVAQASHSTGSNIEASLREKISAYRASGKKLQKKLRYTIAQQ
jgi:hypothetical protein